MSGSLESSVPLLLASASPRRREILKNAGYTFEVCDPGDVEETISTASSPEALALAKARLKAHAIAATRHWDVATLVIGADTLVASGEEVLGKPHDRAEARHILARLSGTRHRVITGLCLWLARPTGGALRLAAGAAHETALALPVEQEAGPLLVSETSWVTMRRMSSGEIQAYVDSGEADGKAGAYAIQETGDRFVERVEGSLSNVAGFPMERFQSVLPEALRRWGLE